MGAIVYPYQGKREHIFCSHPWNSRVKNLCSYDYCCIFCEKVNKCAGVCPTIRSSYSYQNAKVLWRECPHRCTRKECTFRKLFEKHEVPKEMTGSDLWYHKYSFG